MKKLVMNMKLVKTSKLNRILFFIFCFGFSVHCFAQQPPAKEVIIEKEYEPVIREFHRIDLLPEFQDTTSINLQFNYDIKSVAVHGQFVPKPIQPVRLTGEPLTPLQNFYALLGVGTNYPSLLGQIRVNSLRNDNYQWFVGADQSNNFGTLKIKEKNGKENEVYTGFSNTEINARGKRFFDKSTLEGSILYNYKHGNYYGYAVDPDTLKNNLLDLFKNNNDNPDFQFFSKFKSEFSISSFDTDKSVTRYNIGLGFNHSDAAKNVLEDNFKVKVYVDKYFNAQFLGLQANLNYIKNEELIDPINNFVIDVNPWVGLFGKLWRIQAGINTTYGHVTDVPYKEKNRDSLYIYPNVKLHYNIESYFLVPYVEVSGNYQINNFERIIDENFYINPKLSVRPTNNKLIISGGMRGQASSRLGFNINGTFRTVENQYFYVIDVTETLGRFFNVEYGDAKIFTIGGELSWKQSDQLNIILRGSFTPIYDIKDGSEKKEPWHTPKSQIDLFARYKFFNKLTVSTNLFFRGERTVKEQFSDATGILDPIVDVSLMGEYQLDKNFGIFLKLNNLLHRLQYIWDNYQLYRFNVMGGVVMMF